MYINKKFITVTQAGRACLEKQLQIDEANLPDYPRPLKKITKKSKSPFQTLASQYGFAGAIYKYFAP